MPALRSRAPRGENNPVSDDQALKDETIVSLLSRFLLPTRLQRFNEVLSTRTHHLTVVLDGVRNSHNVSAVLRSADAFGLTTVHLVGSRFQYRRGVARGSERWLELIRHGTSEEAVRALRREEFELVTLAPSKNERSPLRSPIGKSSEHSKRIPVTELPFERKLALVFGNELSGVSEPFEAAADYAAFIPMFGFVESLNISVAAAISLFCSTIGPTAPKRRVPTLSIEEQQALLSKWLEMEIRGADFMFQEIEEAPHRKQD